MRLNLALVDLLRGDAAGASAELAAAAAAFARQGREPFLAATAVLELWAAALGHDGPGFDAALARAGPLLATTGFVEADIALAAVRAAEACEAAGDGPRAGRAWRLALAQWAGLGREAERRVAEAGVARCPPA